MSGQWQSVNVAAVNTAATFSVTSGTTSGGIIRLRSLQATISGTGAGSATIVVRDGATAVGTIIMQTSIANAANSSGSVTINNIDLRATSGTLTVESTTGGGANTTIAVSAQGDYAQLGVSYLGGS